MLVTIVDHRVYVTLSRENLRQLNDLLENSDDRDDCLVRWDDSWLLVVHVEDDADHRDHEARLRARRGASDVGEPMEQPVLTPISASAPEGRPPHPAIDRLSDRLLTNA